MLNKSKGNMYEWVTHTANPLSGECLHNCSYCYVNKLKHAKPVIKAKYSGIPCISENGMKQLSGKNKIIFVVDMGDLFADNVDIEIIRTILNKCASKNENTYLFQTKNIQRISNSKDIRKMLYEIKSVILSTTIESNIRYKQMGNSPELLNRIKAIKFLEQFFATQITIEPIMDFNLGFFIEMLKDANVSQINIGADSGKNNLTEPPKEKILELISELSKFTKVKLKKNLKRLLNKSACKQLRLQL